MLVCHLGIDMNRFIASSPTVLSLALSFHLAFDLVARDWPQWRGPLRDGVSRETGLLKTWPEGGPKRLWLYEKAGDGYSAAAACQFPCA